MDGEALSDRQRRVIEEIQRVAALLGVERLSQRDFDKHHEIAGLSTAGYQFGSWNRAVRAAGLEPYESGRSNRGPKLDDSDLLQEIIRVHQQVGKAPSQLAMARFEKYSPRSYVARWGSWVAARNEAYSLYGMPNMRAADIA